jgi:hypothetical protein
MQHEQGRSRKKKTGEPEATAKEKETGVKGALEVEEEGRTKKK